MNFSKLHMRIFPESGLNRIVFYIVISVFIVSVANVHIFSAQKPTKNYLLENEWLAPIDYDGTEISFDINGSYFFASDGTMPGSEFNCSGKYKIHNGKLILYFIDIRNCGIKAECTLEHKKNTPVYPLFLFCKTDGKGLINFESIEFVAANQKIPKGSRRVIDNNNVITLGEQKGVTTDRVHLRSGPGLQYEPVLCTENMIDYTVLEKNTKVTVLARTEEKMKIQKWEAYWYYVEIDGSWHEGDNDCHVPGRSMFIMPSRPGTGYSFYRVWLYGQFVKILEE